MGRSLWLTVFLLGAAGALLVAAGEQGEPPMWRYGGSGKLVSGEWAFDLSGAQRVLADEGPITGFAFGPGRVEVAYCGPAQRGERSGLWIVSASSSYPARRVEGKFWRKTTAPSRLLWAAPEGVTLRGPVWWAPDGSRIAARACSGEWSDLVAVDYEGGDPVWITRNARVIAAAWARRADRIAYVTEEADGRAVWVRAVPAGVAERVGDGGWDLRWSLDGESVRWFSLKSADVWVEMEWQAETDSAREIGLMPARPEGAVRAPDGRVWAAVEQEGEGPGQLVLYSGTSAIGEAVLLPDARPQRVLGWSPDSGLVLVLSETGFVLAVAARAPAYTAHELARPSREFSAERAGILGYPIDADAGAPVWSSDGKMFAYVMARQFTQGTGLVLTHGRDVSLGDIYPLGCLVVNEIRHELLEPVGPLREEVRTVLGNMQVIAASLQMYLADYDASPMSQNADELRQVLADYVDHLTDESVFMRPGTEDEIAVRYLAAPGMRPWDVEDWQDMPVAVVEYLWDYDVVIFGDGRVELFKKTSGY